MKLENDFLKITFTNPDEMTSPRFAHAGFITEVLLNNQWQFCMPEQILPNRRNSKGWGLSGEFIMATGELAKEGEWFFKPGVGLLKQTEDFQKFNIFGSYEVNPFPITIRQSDDQTITFFQKGTLCNGYAADIKKTYQLQNHQLILSIEVVNTGTKHFELSEYQHNFVSLDQILYHESCEIDPQAPAHWILKHQNSTVSIKDTVDFPPSMIIVWAVEHCICAEIYHTVQLAPEEKATWKRTWTFEK